MEGLELTLSFRGQLFGQASKPLDRLRGRIEVSLVCSTIPEKTQLGKYRNVLWLENLGPFERANKL